MFAYDGVVFSVRVGVSVFRRENWRHVLVRGWAPGYHELITYAPDMELPCCLVLGVVLFGTGFPCV